jgi:hypothetical protein
MKFLFQVQNVGTYFSVPACDSRVTVRIGTDYGLDGRSLNPRSGMNFLSSTMSTLAMASPCPIGTRDSLSGSETAAL